MGDADDAGVGRWTLALEPAGQAGHGRRFIQVVQVVGQEFLAQASVDLVFCANPQRSAVKYGKRGRELYSIQDATIACTYAMLAAQELDLATVWVGAFQEEPVRQAASIPSDLVPVAILPIGYAGEDPKPRPRRKLEDLVHA